MTERGRSPGAKGTAFPHAARPQKSGPPADRKGISGKLGLPVKPPGAPRPEPLRGPGAPYANKGPGAAGAKPAGAPAGKRPYGKAGDAAGKGPGKPWGSPGIKPAASPSAKPWDKPRGGPRPARPADPGKADESAAPGVSADASTSPVPARSGEVRPPRRSDKPFTPKPAAPRFPKPKPTGAPRAAHAAKPAGDDSPASAGQAAERPAGEAPAGVRVSKLLAERGLCSRREADEYIAQGLVFVNGERVTELGVRADPGAKITLATEAKTLQEERITVLLHKPVGYVSGLPEDGHQPAVVLVRPESQHRVPGDSPFKPGFLKGLAPAGRLDIDSTGLLVLTQDGRIARQLIGEDSAVEKEYLVRVEGKLIQGGMELLRHGLSLDDKPLKPAEVEWINEDQLCFVLREGKKRQIRRMCELVGLKVVGLKRVRMGRVRLGDLPAGKWRLLKPDERF